MDLSQLSQTPPRIRNIGLSINEYKELVEHIKYHFTEIINQNMETIDFDDIDVEDRLLSSIRADNPGSKLKRMINTYREDATSTIYKRWDTQKIIDKIHTDLENETTILKVIEDNRENDNEYKDIRLNKILQN